MNKVDADLEWRKVSPHAFVHRTGARIEKRGFPEKLGWYLVDPTASPARQCFSPTPDGCDEALVVFSGRRAARSVLLKLLKGD